MSFWGRLASVEPPEIEAQTVRSDAVGVERRRLAQGLHVVAWLMVGALIVTPCTGFASGLWFWHVWRLILALSVALFVASRAARWSLRPMAGTLALSREGVTLESRDGAVTVPWSEVRGATLVPDGEQVTLCIERANGDMLHAGVASIAEGAGLLRAAGLDAGRRAVNISLGPVWHHAAFFGVSAVGGTFLTLAALFTLSRVWPWIGHLHDLSAAGLALLAGVFGTLGLLTFGPWRVTLGADGVTIRTGWRRRFIPYEHIAAFEQHGKGLIYGRIFLKNGERITLSSTDGTATSVAALRASIEVAKSGRRDASHAAAVLALLERQGDSFEAWRERVRSLARASRAFRETAVTPEDLLRVIEDPAATPEQRVGAMMALSAYEDASGLPRVRVAIEACANEPLRDALDDAASDALDEWTAEAADQTRARSV